jgi:hypothetical protein
VAIFDMLSSRGSNDADGVTMTALRLATVLSFKAAELTNDKCHIPLVSTFSPSETATYLNRTRNMMLYRRYAAKSGFIKLIAHRNVIPYGEEQPRPGTPIGLVKIGNAVCAWGRIYATIACSLV